MIRKYKVDRDGTVHVEGIPISFNPDDGCWYVHRRYSTPEDEDGSFPVHGIFSGPRGRNNAVQHARRVVARLDAAAA